MPSNKRLSHDDYSVGWLCALPLEMAAARVMLDKVHDTLPVRPNDNNSYILGQIGNHNIVVAGLPSGEYGLVSAATVTAQLLATFRSVRFGLLVGIGGGIPSETADIRLGDIVVSKPEYTHGGVIQYDYGKMVKKGGFERTGMLNRPPQILLTALTKLQACYDVHGSQIPRFLSEMKLKYPQMQSKYTDVFGGRLDRLFKASYTHPETMDTCDQCDPAQVVVRPDRIDNCPVVHYGLIASGNKVVKDSQFRDRLGQEYGVLCVEMEAAGLMNNFPCLVIRGICDYADSHKNKDWQGYAASVAAAYAKELLLTTSSSGTVQIPNTDHEDHRKGRPYMNCNVDPLAQAQRGYVMFEKCHTLDYCMPLDTNQQLTPTQHDQVIQYLLSHQSVEPMDCLRYATALSRRHAGQARSDMIDIGQFWLHPRFRKWESSNQNDLVLIKGDYKSRLAVRWFCVNFIQLVRKQNAPIIWALRARNSTHGLNERPGTVVLRDLMCQILQLSHTLWTEKDVSAYCAQLQATHEPIQWMGLIGKAVSSLSRLYILIEVDPSESSHNDAASLRENFSWVAAFLRLFDELNQRGCLTRVKVVLTTYAATTVPPESQTGLRVADTHQLVIPVHHRRPVGRSAPRSTLLVRRKRY